MQNLKKTKLIDTTEIENYYTFHHVDKETAEEVYFCNCGKKITEKDNKNENPDEVTVTLEDNKYYSDMDIYDKIEGASVICPKCEADYSIAKNFQRVKPSNTNFYGAFKFENTEKRITLHRAKIKATCTLNSKKVSFKEDIDYISVDKENKKLFIKVSTKKEEEFSLDSIVKIINSFFKIEDLSVMDNLIDVHRCLSALARIVSDAKISGVNSKEYLIIKAPINIEMGFQGFFITSFLYAAIKKPITKKNPNKKLIAKAEPINAKKINVAKPVLRNFLDFFIFNNYHHSNF